MEQHNTLTGMLDLMTDPAFCVKGGTITYANRPALACMLTEGMPVSQILFTGAEEYSQFTGGCLYLTLNIGNTYRGATVTRIEEFDVFVAEPADELSTLQSLALAGARRSFLRSFQAVSVSVWRLLARFIPIPR